ncbi:MAG TPA: toll/interleukin-1 receptor domain-containing protein [Chryseosolibacter sp.]|nr:toll/interleukin-1 receptor domain-containing protein [Chryseosolibacter sp.]
MRPNKYEYDAFISHAVEDKMPIANELCAKLEAAGLNIWYSGKELGVGDSIEKTIEKGLNCSRYGIVIFSPTYLAKNWTIREFYTLLAKEIEEHKVILPVLYNVTPDDLKKKDLLMADRFAVNAEKGIDFVVARLVAEIQKTTTVKKEKQQWLSKIWFLLVLSLLANIALLSKDAFYKPGIYEIVRAPDHTSVGYTGNKGSNPEILFAEVQGLFRQLNSCNCNNTDEQVSNVNQTRLIRSTPGAHGNDDDAYRQSPDRGKKMTMSVVFQIETMGDGFQEHMEREDKIRDTISLLDQDGSPGLLSKNGDLSAVYRGSECRHHVNEGY